MQDKDLVDDFCMLLLEESPTLQVLFDDWLGEIRTRVASAPEEVPSAFDATVAVACLCQSTLGNDEEAVRTEILTRNPYCQLVAIIPRSSLLTIHQDNYDACLQRPILEDEFRQTIETRLACGVYSALLREFYDLNTKLLWMRRTETPAETLANDDLAEVRTRYEQLCEQLNALQETLSTDALTDISRSIALHKRYLTQPAADADHSGASKYHPRRCPACKLSWGVKHGNELGTGVVSIGAGVWKCLRCSEIVHGLGETGRQVMRG